MVEVEHATESLPVLHSTETTFRDRHRSLQQAILESLMITFRAASDLMA
jgi:hypothetical protein